MHIEIDYYKKNPYSNGIGIIRHLTITEEDIIELAKKETNEDGYELHGYTIDRVVCD